MTSSMLNNISSGEAVLLLAAVLLLVGDTPRHRLVQVLRIVAVALTGVADVLDGHR